MTRGAKSMKQRGKQITSAPGLKTKDLCGIPWAVAKTLQQPYYAGRIAAEKDRAWLAAMIDGEGTICGFRHERKDNGGVRTGVLAFITNSDERILDECDRIWPGSRYTEKLKPGDTVLGGTATRTCWRWELQAAEDRSAFVRELYPYLIAKRKQALVAWNMLDFVQSAKRMGRGGETTTVKEKRDYLAHLLSDLNHRRPVDLPSWLVEPPTLYEPGWYLRSDIIWSKSNPMPESVTDRPTKAHEYVFLLTKQPRYWFDAEAVREPVLEASFNTERVTSGQSKRDALGEMARTTPVGRTCGVHPSGGRNVRSVWQIATQPYPEAHFATFPEELARRCILAGCPTRVCQTCGKPSERIVRTEFVKLADRRPTRKAQQDGADMADINSANKMGYNHTETVGWSDCGHNAWRVGVTLDPFIGSGTVAKVARDHGRHSIGIDLSSDYLELAARRLQQLSLLT